MISRSVLAGLRVYLDSNVFIYALEAMPRYGPLCLAILEGLEKRDFRGITSELTIAETLARPMRDNRLDLAKTYDDLLQNGESLEVVPVSRSVLIESARLRALVRNPLPDSIHLATAIEAKCDYFITGDKSLKPSSALRLITLDEFLA